MVNREELRKVVRDATAYTEKKASLPILSTLRFVEDGRVQATNLDIYCEIANPALEGLRGVVPADLIRKAVEALKSETLEIEISEEKWVIKGVRGSVSVPIIGDDELFPEFPSFPTDGNEFSTDTLITAVKYCGNATPSSYDQIPPAVALTPYGVVGTDGYRLHLVQGITSDSQIVAPLHKVIKSLSHAPRINLANDDTFVFLTIGEAIKLALRSYNQFPDISAVMSIFDGDYPEFTVNRNELVNTLKSLIPFSTEKVAPVTLEPIDVNTLKMTLAGSDVTTEFILPITAQQPLEETITINARYFLDAIPPTGDLLTIKYSSEHLILSAGDFKAIIMGMDI